MPVSMTAAGEVRVRWGLIDLTEICSVATLQYRCEPIEVTNRSQRGREFVPGPVTLTLTLENLDLDQLRVFRSWLGELNTLSIQWTDDQEIVDGIATMIGISMPEIGTGEMVFLVGERAARIPGARISLEEEFFSRNKSHG